MANGFFRALCRIGIFMVCAQTVVHFRANASYEKLLKLLVSVMILLQIFIPVIEMFNSDFKKEFEDRAAYFEQSLNEGFTVDLEDNRFLDKIIEDEMIEEKNIEEENIEYEGIKKIEPVEKIKFSE